MNKPINSDGSTLSAPYAVTGRIHRHSVASIVFVLVASNCMPSSLAEYADEQYANLRSSPLLSAKADGITDILQRLLDLKKRFANGEEVDLPFVNVAANGKTYFGQVYDLQLAGREPTLLMETREPEGGRNTGVQLAFIRVSSIDAVEIRDAWTHTIQATMGYGDFSALPTPTRLDLKRKMANFSTWLSQKAQKEITYDMDLTSVQAEGRQLRSIAWVMSETTGEIYKLLSEPTPGQKVRSDFKAVAFIIGKQADAKYSNGVLTIVINLALPENPHRREYGPRIRALLMSDK